MTRTEIKDGETVKSSDLIEVELVVNAKNDYEYLVFEDMKAAGFEPVDLRSGASYGDGLSSNVELRDEKVAFFVDRLPQGRRVLRYRVRAEVPGTVSRVADSTVTRCMRPKCARSPTRCA